MLLPALTAPVQAAPLSSSSLSSAGSFSSSLPIHPDDVPDEPVDPADEIVVDVPGYGAYTISSDIQGSVDSEGATEEDLLSAAVFSADYEGDVGVRTAALAALTQERRAEVTTGLAALHAGWVAPPSTVGPLTPIVVLGNGLAADGSVHPNLENRLQAALKLTRERPKAVVVVSGGPTAHGPVEPHVMKDWLLEHGVEENRIIVEDRSYDTVSNARFSREALPDADSVIVVTSRDHVHRAAVDFTVAFGPEATVAGVGAENDPLTPMPGDLGIYRDVVNWYLA